MRAPNMNWWLCLFRSSWYHSMCGVWPRHLYCYSNSPVWITFKFAWHLSPASDELHDITAVFQCGVMRAARRLKRNNCWCISLTYANGSRWCQFRRILPNPSLTNWQERDPESSLVSSSQQKIRVDVHDFFYSFTTSMFNIAISDDALRKLRKG